MYISHAILIRQQWDGLDPCFTAAFMRWQVVRLSEAIMTYVSRKRRYNYTEHCNQIVESQNNGSVTS